MHSLLPSVRLVTLLRDPVARAYSSFYHHCDRNSRMLEHKGRVVFNGDCHAVEVRARGGLGLGLRLRLGLSSNQNRFR